MCKLFTEKQRAKLLWFWIKVSSSCWFLDTARFYQNKIRQDIRRRNKAKYRSPREERPPWINPLAKDTSEYWVDRHKLKLKVGLLLHIKLRLLWKLRVSHKRKLRIFKLNLKVTFCSLYLEINRIIDESIKNNQQVLQMISSRGMVKWDKASSRNFFIDQSIEDESSLLSFDKSLGYAIHFI